MMNWLKRLLIGLVLIALISGGGWGISPAAAASSRAVELKSEVTVKKPPLSLSRIIKGGLPPGLEEIYLGNLPDPGRGKFISRGYIMMCAREADKPLPKFKGQEIYANVHRPARKLTREEIFTPVEQLLKKQLGQDNLRKIKLIRVPQSVKISPGQYQLELGEISPYHKLHETNWYKIKVRQGRTITNTFRVNARVRDFRKVVVTTRKITEGTKVTTDDFELRKKEIKHFKGDVLTDTEAVRGYETTQLIPAGKAVHNRYLKKPLLVERNEEVNMRYEMGGIVITTQGVAQDNGHRGDKIIVENRSSEEQVYAEVIDRRKVLVKNGAAGK